MMIFRFRRAQSAVETMLIVPIIAMVIMSMYYLWSMTWASQNAHLRAREFVLHGDTYLQDRGSDATGSNPFDGSNYKRADSTTFSFESKASDESLSVFGSSETIEVKAVITSD